MYNVDRNFGCRISDEWTLKGLKTVVMENEFLRISILADKGSDIYEFLYKPLDIDFMWRSPFGLRNPNHGLVTKSGTAGPFVDYYEGGWQEILPSGGSPCVYKNVEYGQHGEISNLPWKCQIIKDDPAEVACQFTVRAIRTPLLIEKKLTLKKNESVLTIEENLVNESAEEIDLMWGHHLAFGEPFLDEHCRLDTPAQKIAINHENYSENHRFVTGQQFNWPMAQSKNGIEVDFHEIPHRTQASEDMTYLLDLQEPWYALTHTKKSVGFGLRWSHDIFKYLWYWQVFGGGAGYPWYGRTYNIGLEPWTSMPTSGLTEAVKHGSHLTLKPNEIVATKMLAVVYTGKSKVNRIAEDGKVF